MKSKIFKYKMILLVVHLFFLKAYSQNLFYVTAPHYNDSISYNFLDFIIEEKTTKDDSIIILMDIGVLHKNDTLYTEYGLCESTVKAINELSKPNRKILTAGLGSFINEIIELNTGKSRYVDSICKKMSGSNLAMCYANQCYQNNIALRDTLLKYSGLTGIEKRMLSLSLSIDDPEHLISEKLKLLKELSHSDVKVFYLTDIWSCSFEDYQNISLLPKLIISTEGRLKQNRFKNLNNETNSLFLKIGLNNLGRKCFISYNQNVKASQLNKTEIYYTKISHPCYSVQDPIPLKKKIKKKRDR